MARQLLAVTFLCFTLWLVCGESGESAVRPRILPAQGRGSWASALGHWATVPQLPMQDLARVLDIPMRQYSSDCALLLRIIKTAPASCR
jgi:hypothetical protein